MPAKKRAITVVKIPIILQNPGQAPVSSIRPVTKVWDIENTLEDLLKYIERISKSTVSEMMVVFENEIPDPGLEIVK